MTDKPNTIRRWFPIGYPLWPLSYFWCPRFERRNVDKKQSYMKTETYKLRVFLIFCQISSKSILIILSYTVSKLVHFLRHSVV